MADTGLMFMYRLAAYLHKTLDEILAIPVSELYGWAAFFKVNDRQQKSP